MSNQEAHVQYPSKGMDKQTYTRLNIYLVVIPLFMHVYISMVHPYLKHQEKRLYQETENNQKKRRLESPRKKEIDNVTNKATPPFYFHEFNRSSACEVLRNCLPGTWLSRPSRLSGAFVFAVKLSDEQWRNSYSHNETPVAEYQAVPCGNGCYNISKTNYVCTLEEVPNKFDFFKNGYIGEHYNIPEPKALE